MLTALACIVMAPWSVGADAAPVINSIDPTVVDAELVNEWVVTGEGLGGVNSASLSGPGGVSHPLTVASKSDGEVVLHGQAIYAPAHYHLRVSDGAASAFVPWAIEIKRGNDVLLGSASDTGYVPTNFAYIHARWQVLIPVSELGGIGSLHAISVYPDSATAFDDADVTIRVMTVAASSFDSNQLSDGSWWTLYDGTAPAASNGRVLFSGSSFFYPGSDSLLLDIIISHDSLKPAPLLSTRQTGTTRFRAGISPSPVDNPLNWGGSAPATRFLTHQMPKIGLHFIGFRIDAAFTQSASNINVGEQVTFTSMSPNADRVRWDIGRDGVFERTGTTYVHTFTGPGVFDVQLNASSGFFTDSYTVPGAVVVGGGVEPDELWELY